MEKFEKAKVIFITGRPGSGKTRVALKWCLDYLNKTNQAVQIFSAEMMSSEVERIVKLISRKLALENLPLLHIDDTGDIHEGYITEQIMELQKRTDVGLVVMDYIQLMRGPFDLKEMAQKLNICLVVLAQLNRKNRNSDDLYFDPDFYDDADLVYRVKNEEGYFNIYEDIDDGRMFELIDSIPKEGVCLS